MEFVNPEPYLEDPELIEQIVDPRVIEELRDVVRSDLLAVEDNVRGLVADSAHAELDDGPHAEQVRRWKLRHGIEPGDWRRYLNMRRKYLENQAKGWPTDKIETAARGLLAEWGATGAEVREILAEADEAEAKRRFKSAFYTADEVDGRDLPWGEDDDVLRAPFAQWGGDAHSWQSDQDSAPLLVEDFGRDEPPQWIVEDARDQQALGYYAQLRKLARALDDRLALVRAWDEAGRRTETPEEWEARAVYPHPRFHADGVVEAEAQLTVQQPPRYRVIARHGDDTPVVTARQPLRIGQPQEPATCPEVPARRRRVTVRIRPEVEAGTKRIHPLDRDAIIRAAKARRTRRETASERAKLYALLAADTERAAAS